MRTETEKSWAKRSTSGACTDWLEAKDTHYDVVTCALSIEYLVQPVKIFKEMSRVLRPGDTFIVAFSNRWFPEKTIRVWEDLHDFERIGLVMEYFYQSAALTLYRPSRKEDIQGLFQINILPVCDNPTRSLP